ncbi:hypothetical protein [Diaphorobacter sp.]|uniref:hypothetical protein n=1 Tax=Diaphorobacter sp. TaxID=1934310 RepID=UPI0025868440|nr:hypothetical protein [Diaphorobacter sp.]
MGTFFLVGDGPPCLAHADTQALGHSLHGVALLRALARYCFNSIISTCCLVDLATAQRVAPGLGAGAGKNLG